MKKDLKKLEERLSEETEKYRQKLNAMIKRSPFLRSFVSVDLVDPKLTEEICERCKRNKVITFDNETLETIDMLTRTYNYHYQSVKDVLGTNLFKVCNECREHPICQTALLYLNTSNPQITRLLTNSVHRIYAKWVWMLCKEFSKINR